MLKSKRTKPSVLYLYPAHRGAVGFVCGHRPDKEIIPYRQKTQSKTREAGLGLDSSYTHYFGASPSCLCLSKILIILNLLRGPCGTQDFTMSLRRRPL